MTTTPAPTGDAAGQLEPAIREALERTITQIFGCKPQIGDEPARSEGEGLSAAIRCEGDEPFTLVLSVSRDESSPLMKTFTGVPIGWEADILPDVTGELLNVIAGDVVAELAERRVEVRMSLPTVERTLDPAEFAAGATFVADFGVAGDGGRFRLGVLREEAAS